MSTSKQLTESLSSLKRRRSHLRLWRGVREPFDALSTRGARINGGRWHPPGVDALYLSFEPATVRAELTRTAELQGDPEAAIYPVRLAETAVDAEVVELVDPEVLADLGVDTPLSILVPRSQTQRVGAAAVGLGLEGLVVPSVAARAENVLVFPANLAAPVEVVRERRVSSPGRWP
ncbi:MAG: RES family NAD+ phosphorylase [Solirubrobacterales bacterium]